MTLRTTSTCLDREVIYFTLSKCLSPLSHTVIAGLVPDVLL